MKDETENVYEEVLPSAPKIRMSENGRQRVRENVMAKISNEIQENETKEGVRPVESKNRWSVGALWPSLRSEKLSYLGALSVIIGLGGLAVLTLGNFGDETTTAQPTTTESATSGTGDDRDDNGGSERNGKLAYGLNRCVSDSSRLTADPTFYRDTPVYVGNEQPVEEVRDWAQKQPGFEDIWVDRENNGWISVGFSENAAARQVELETEFPDVGVVAVEVTTTEAELVVLRDQVSAALEGLSSSGLGHSVSRGMVEVSVPVLDDETLAPLAPFAGPTLCVDGTDPADAIIAGPQPTEGEGWRLLGTDRTGRSYRTGLATNPDQYVKLWSAAGLAGQGPAVDFETEIVIWFGAVYGQNCPIRLDSVVFDNENRLVYGDFVIPGNPTACNNDANPEAYVVAVQRDNLTEAPFAVQLDADDPPAGAPEERTNVRVDLRPAGSTVADADVNLDSDSENFESNRGELTEVFEPGLVVEDGFDHNLLIDLNCSVDIIGPLNKTMWQATDADLAAGPPPAWTEDANDGLAEAVLSLDVDPARLTVTVRGEAVSYTPIAVSETATMSCN